MARRRNRTPAPSIIGPDMVVQGDLTSQGDIHIDGSVNGNVRATTLTLGPEAVVNGAVIAEAAMIHGCVRGGVRARDVRVCASGRVEGDLVHSLLAVEPGAFIQGALFRVEDMHNLETVALPAPPAAGANGLSPETEESTEAATEAATEGAAESTNADDKAPA